MHTEEPKTEEYVPAEQRVQLPSKTEPIPETYFPGLHIKQALEEDALSEIEYFPGRQKVQFTTSTCPDPL